MPQRSLVGLNRLLKLRLSEKQLEWLALRLGADVPFFIRGRPARARGIGERLSPLGRIFRPWIVIVYPGFAVWTAWVYGNLPRKLTKHRVNTSITTSPRDFDNLATLLVNDLESVTIKRYRKIAAIKQRLLRLGAWEFNGGEWFVCVRFVRSKQKAEEAFSGCGKRRRFRRFLCVC